MSQLESGFLTLWKAMAKDLPEPIREYRFAPPRRWRFDFAFPQQLLGIEIHGGQWSGGRHNRGAGLQSDCEKQRAAIKAGWRILPYTTSDMNERPVQVIEEVMEVLFGHEIK